MHYVRTIILISPSNSSEVADADFAGIVVVKEFEGSSHLLLWIAIKYHIGYCTHTTRNLLLIIVYVHSMFWK